MQIYGHFQVAQNGQFIKEKGKKSSFFAKHCNKLIIAPNSEHLQESLRITRFSANVQQILKNAQQMSGNAQEIFKLIQKYSKIINKSP